MNKCKYCGRKPVLTILRVWGVPRITLKCMDKKCPNNKRLRHKEFKSRVKAESYWKLIQGMRVSVMDLNTFLSSGMNKALLRVIHKKSPSG